jgi:hypothetical protein
MSRFVARREAAVWAAERRRYLRHDVAYVNVEKIRSYPLFDVNIR